MCCPRGGTAGDSLADAAVGTAPITSLIDYQIFVSDLLPHITLLLTILSQAYCKSVRLILEAFLKLVNSLTALTSFPD